MGKLVTLEQAIELCEAWRREGRRVVLTNGCFDLLHVGHVDYLERARALGDALVVGVNDDESVRRLKGPGRPITPAPDRVRVVAALAAVDLVVVFSGDTADELLAALRPDVYAKGGDWSAAGGKRLPELETARRIGAEVRFLPYLEGYATSALIRRICSGLGGAGAGA
ncbi:MAG: adenylyltransferase/cytidyltransferase family protein [Anaerolineae bacterium]